MVHGFSVEEIVLVAVAALFAPLGITTGATAVLAADSAHFWFAALFGIVATLSAVVMIDDVFFEDRVSARILRALTRN